MAQSKAGSRAEDSPGSTSPESEQGGATAPKSVEPIAGKSGASTAREPSSSARSPGAAAKPKSAGRSAASSRSRDGRGNVDAAKDTLGSAGSAVGTAAKKAKMPAIAGGAALAGLAGGIALAARTGPKRVLGVPIPGTRKPLVKINGPTIKVKNPRSSQAKSVSEDLLKAAGQVGSAGRQVGDVLNEVQRVRGAWEDRSRRRSPIEVVLESLTQRRGGRD